MDISKIRDRREQALKARTELIENIEKTQKNIEQAKAQIEQWTAMVNAQTGAIDSLDFTLRLAEEDEAQPAIPPLPPPPLLSEDQAIPTPFRNRTPSTGRKRLRLNKLESDRVEKALADVPSNHNPQDVYAGVAGPDD